MEFTHPSVIEGIRTGAGWADPTMDPTTIDWAGRQARAAIPFRVVDGRPVNPREQTTVRHGRNEMGHWGEALAADALVTVSHRPWLRAAWRWLTRQPTAVRHVLLVERDDGHGWAIPGGHVDPGEAPLSAAIRELEEETGLTTGSQSWRESAPRYVPDPRASDEAWMVTAPCLLDLGVARRLPAVEGRDDAERAAWIPAGSYAQLVDDLAEAYEGRVFAAHVEMLREHLA